MASLSTIATTEVRNLIGGQWLAPTSEPGLELTNPATGEPLGRSPLGSAAEVDAAVQAAQAAFPAWRATPVGDRIQFLFRLKMLMEQNLDGLAETITRENGKTLAEGRAELRRGIENVEVACGAPVLMQGYSLEDIAPGIDEVMVRQPLGVCAVITPFNFPAMIPLWFVPYAIATGNTVVLKPSDRVPFSAARLVDLILQTGLPAGVVNLVNGGKPAVDALLDHPLVRAISFVGSTPVAQYVYARGSATGKRVQCQGGAKNHVVVLPDADQETTTKIIADSAFGCAGQRCLAVSVTVTVGEAKDWFRESIAAAASGLKVGDGLDPASQMGPVITQASRERVVGLIGKGAHDGANAIVDGRSIQSAGSFVGPTVLDGLPASSPLMDTEIFGPVLSVVHADTVDDAMRMIERSPYGNASSIFTSSGASARKFRNAVSTGNVGVNIGVPAPMAWFPFSGWKGSFFGVMHAQGRDAVEFFTDKKVIVERWPKEWSRKF
ncbi:MAG TPA: CoA-acylating methylmalonate-semialdehyde dehydrogenase [Terracidiphilus sp.]|jgi:malonate-semialdehyde dehydrogenase (acetylating)/methylmalonate-semialdehyde dehydrogenase|nr:CoA-acylating methylmalonate-semialdehyde dehydrogenase [Terracidiphilus sp.]